MEKETILNLSRKENKNKYDEYEMTIVNFSYRTSHLVGGIVCALISFITIFLPNSTGITMAVCAVYFSMCATNSIVKFRKMKKKHDGFWSITDSLIALAAYIIFFIRVV